MPLAGSRLYLTLLWGTYTVGLCIAPGSPCFLGPARPAALGLPYAPPVGCGGDRRRPTIQ